MPLLRVLRCGAGPSLSLNAGWGRPASEALNPTSQPSVRFRARGKFQMGGRVIPLCKHTVRGKSGFCICSWDLWRLLGRFIEYNVSIEDFVSKVPGSCVCVHTPTPDKTSTQRNAHIQLWPHRNAYTEFWTQKYMQLFTHRNTFIPLQTRKYIQLRTHVKLHTDVHRNTCTKEAHTYTYKPTL